MAKKPVSDLVKFGTVEFPLRSSQLQQIVKCPMMAALKFLEEEYGSSAAADTGSACHKAVELWHNNGKNDLKAIQGMVLGKEAYPLADTEEAAKMFLGYAKDPRNIEAEIFCTECKIEVTLPPHKDDETKKEVVLSGTVDQIRVVNGVYKVYDVKTSKYPGDHCEQEYIYQIAAYVLGASKMLNTNVEPGAFILPREYLKKGAGPKPLPAFYNFAWTHHDVHAILSEVTASVAKIRNAAVYINPGVYCRWCPAGGVHTCIPKLHTINTKKIRNG